MVVTDKTAAPQDRYVVANFTPVRGVTFYGVVDRVMGKRVASGLPTWAAAHCEAQRRNREARAANKPAAEQAVPCCDCTAKLKSAEERAERYRHALAQIWRYCSGTALRYASQALFADEREKGEAS